MEDSPNHVRCMLPLVLFAVCSAASVAWSDPPASAPARHPTSQPASRPATDACRDERLQKLIRELSSPSFKARQAAQEALAAMGESALPCLLPHINDADAEIASRVVLLVGRPVRADLRAEAGYRLLISTDPDWMERGVHMLFESPAEVCDMFVALAEHAPQSSRAIVAPVQERLIASRERWRRFDERYQRMRRKHAEVAEKERQMQLDSNRYEAEAAYWLAHDALLDGAETGGDSPASQPAAERRQSGR